MTTNELYSDDQRSRFSHWLRTGRWLQAQVADPTLEVKFNPYHDPRNGQFTFAPGGAGGADMTRPPKRPQRNNGNRRWDGDSFSGGGGGTGGGAGASGSFSWPKPGATPKPSHHPIKISQPNKGGKSFGGGGFPGGGGGSFGGAGASATWGGTFPTSSTTNAHQAKVVGSSPARPAWAILTDHGKSPEPSTHVEKSGYVFRIDASRRTHQAAGELSLAPIAPRSKINQIQAGGADRRRTDDGGHFIAVRFNGPSDAFNHFAQDASFNRGRYRALEDEWAKDLRAGKHVSVAISASYKGGSKRPSSVGVRWTINGHSRYRAFANE